MNNLYQFFNFTSCKPFTTKYNFISQFISVFYIYFLKNNIHITHTGIGFSILPQSTHLTQIFLLPQCSPNTAIIMNEGLMGKLIFVDFTCGRTAELVLLKTISILGIFIIMLLVHFNYTFQTIRLVLLFLLSYPTELFRYEKQCLGS